MIFATKDNTELKKEIFEIAATIREKLFSKTSTHNACGIASVELRDELLKRGIWAKQVDGRVEGMHWDKKLSLVHKWNRVGELTIDITLDQFKHILDDKVEKVNMYDEKPTFMSCPEDWWYETYECDYDPMSEYRTFMFYYEAEQKLKKVGE